MKEKIIKILESQFSVVEYEDPDTGFTESTTIDVLTTDEFPDIVDKLEILVNQEVEKRIAERMPDKRDTEQARTNVLQQYLVGNISLYDVVCQTESFYCSRLSQKTEGGGE